MKKSYYLFNPGRLSRKDNTLKFVPVDEEGRAGPAKYLPVTGNHPQLPDGLNTEGKKLVAAGYDTQAVIPLPGPYDRTAKLHIIL